MKKSSLIAFSLLMVSLQSYASENGVYIGVGVGQVLYESVEDIDGSVDDSFGSEILVGYKFSGNVSAELSYVDGAKSDIDFAVDGFRYQGELDFSSISLYGVYRTHGDIYFMAKIGVLSEKIKMDAEYCGMITGSYSCIGLDYYNIPSSYDDTGISAGIGGGWKVHSNLLVEAEFTILEEDIGFVTVGANYHF